MSTIPRAVDWVQQSAKISAIAQIAFALFSLVGFSKVLDEDKQFLLLLLVLDTAVQLIEFVFYASFIYIGKLATVYRYIDWYVSTPIMLVTTMMFLEYLDDKTVTLGAFGGEFQNQIIFVVLMNAIMLSFGVCAKLGVVPRAIAVPLGWIPFLLVFAVIFAANAYKTPGGAAFFAFVAVVWSLYGVAALLSDTRKNVAYNLLDVVAKNVYGVIVTVYLISD